ncbi:glutamyl-tRNA reductase [soil metagenome]
MKTICCFGINHLSAPMALLEKVSFGPKRMGAFVRRLKREIAFDEIFGLSTCNRIEFYFVSDAPDEAWQKILTLLQDERPGVLRAELEERSYLHRDNDAAAHLLRVAAGVDSLVVGEAEILGQIRRAFEDAEEAGAVGATLDALITRAITFGRRVRVETKIGRGNVSVASVAHRAAREAVADLEKKSLLIVGAGETAQNAATHFVKDGVGALCVASRSAERAKFIVEELGAKFLPMERVESGLATADVVLCASAAHHYVITAEGLGEIMMSRADRPMLIVDLGMPRNVDPECATIAGVTMLSIESLEAVAEKNRSQRKAEIAIVEQMIAAETLNFSQRDTGLQTDALVDAIRKRAETTRREHLEKYCRDLPPAQRDEIMRFSDSLLKSILHDVTANIRSLDPDSETAELEYELICRLFNVPLPARKA